MLLASLISKEYNFCSLFLWDSQTVKDGYFQGTSMFSSNPFFFFSLFLSPPSFLLYFFSSFFPFLFIYFYYDRDREKYGERGRNGLVGGERERHLKHCFTAHETSPAHSLAGGVGNWILNLGPHAWCFANCSTTCPLPKFFVFNLCIYLLIRERRENQSTSCNM